MGSTVGTAQAKLTSGVMTFGGATVGATAASVTPTTFDTTVKTPVTATVANTVSVAAGATSYTEGKSATFTVSLSSAQATATTVNYAFAGTGGAVLGTDTGTAIWTGATATATTLTFPAGIVTATVTVPVTFDTSTETGEGVSLTLSSPSTGITLGTATASTSLADATAPTFTLTSDVVAGTPTQEGKVINFTITPSSTVDKDTVLTVNLTGQAVGGISSTASAADFTAAQTVTFKAGDTAARTTSITVVDDTTTEGIEGYKATLLDNTFTEKASVTGTITDPTTTYVLTGATSVNEDASVTYTVTADRAAPTGGITIPYTLSGNATLGTDYTGSTAAGNITIAAGATTGTLILNAVADNLTESAAENIIVTLGTPSTGNVTTGTVTTLISDTSQGLTAGQVTLSASASSVNEGSAVTYTVTLGTAAPTGGLSIPYTLSGTSALTSDYTGPSATTGNITVAAGATTGTLVVTTVADNSTEGAETLVATLGTLPSGYTLVTGKGTATTTINDTSVAVAGQTFTLTSAIDSFTGTSGNDIFLGDSNVTSSADQLVGGSGTDTLKLFGNSPKPVISGIETVYLNGNTAGFDVSSNSEVTSLQLDDPTTAKTYTVTTGQAVSIATVDAGETVSVAGNTPTSLALTLNSVAATGADATIDLTGTKVASLAITTATAASQVTLNNTGAALTTITIAGDQKLELGSAVTTITSINAGSSTGGVDIDAIGASALTFTGGTGNDRIDLTTTLGTTDTIVGGTGTDTIAFTGAADATFTSTTGARISGFEVLEVGETADGKSYDVDNIITNNVLTGVKLTVTGAGATTTVNNINSGAIGNITFTGDAPEAVLTAKDFVSGGTSDTATINLNNDTSDNANGVDPTLTFANADILNFVTTKSDTVGLQVNAVALTATDAEKIVVTGNDSFSVTTSAGTVVTEIDASGLTGTAALTAITTSSAQTSILVKGTANADTITLDNAANASATIYSGGGSDAILLDQGATNVSLLKFTASALSTGDVKAGDALTVGVATASTAGHTITFDFASGVEALLKNGGVTLGSSASNVTILGTSLSASTNVAASINSAGADDIITFQIDLNGDGTYVAGSDWQTTITLVGNTTGNQTLVYNAANDYFVLTVV